MKAPTAREFVDRAARYIGETLRLRFGGYWTMETRANAMYPNGPILRFPETTGPRGQVPEAPHFLITRLAHRRTGAELVRIYDGLKANYDEREVEPWADASHVLDDQADANS